MPDELSPAERQHAELLAKIVHSRFPQYWRDTAQELARQPAMAPFATTNESYRAYEQMPSQMNNVFLHLAGEPADEQTKKKTQDFLNWMRERTSDNEDFILQSHYDASRSKQYALSEGGAKNFEANREYNLARSMMESGDHQAPGTGWDWVASLIGEFLPAERTLSEYRLPKPYAEALGQNYRENRAKEALYWWNEGKQGVTTEEMFNSGTPGRGEEPVWATGALGAKSPNDSLTTWTGIGNTVGRADNPIGYYGVANENFRTGPFNKTAHLLGQMAHDVATAGKNPINMAKDYGSLMSDISSSFTDLPAQQAVASKVTRRTPIMPDDPEQRRTALAVQKAYEDSQRFGQEAIRAYSPQLFEMFGETPRYFTKGEDALANLPGSYLADPLSLFGLSKATFGGVRGVANFAKHLIGPSEVLEEGLFTGVPTLNAPTPDPDMSENVYLDTPSGREYIKPTDPRYKQAYQKGLSDERDRRKLISSGYKVFD